MKYSLIVIEKTNNDKTINGTWLQGCCGVTLEKATERARATEKVNSNRIKIAVVEELNGIQNYDVKYNLTRLHQ